MTSIFIATLLGVATVQASPALVSRQSITALTAPQIDAFSPYTYFASAAYCAPSKINSWSCGTGCRNNAGFEPVASGGDGNSVQYWYVGYDPSLHTVVVAHEGTDESKILSIVTDLDVALGNLDPSLFPGLSSKILVHSGFRDDHKRTAADILSSVEKAMTKYRTNSVTLVGHSLGAALSLLDSVHLPLHLPSGTTFRTVLYGLPRVGNKEFADYVDANLHLTHINNLKDPIPVVPPKSWGYVHPSGEVHISKHGKWMACPGQDNPSNECSVGDVPDFFDSDPDNHDGPYNGIVIDC